MPDRRARKILTAVAPLAFVLLWSTGHIATKLGDPYIEPFKFLAIRFAFSTILVALMAAALGARWPSGVSQLRHTATAGLMLHAGYLGGVFVSIDLGLSAGALAVITGIQPLLTGVLVASLFGERVTLRQWGGLWLGFAGVALVVWEKAGLEDTPIAAFAAAFFCLFSITLGTIYQKRYCGDQNIFSANAVQLCVSALACGALSLVLETGRTTWAADLVIAIGWQVVILSGAAVSLFYWLLRRNETTRVTGLFYLMAPSTAVMGWLLFGETFGAFGLAGLVGAVAGFWMVYAGCDRIAPATSR